MNTLTDDTLQYVFGLLPRQDQFYIGCFLRPRLGHKLQQQGLVRLPAYSDEEGVIDVAKLATFYTIDDVDRRLINAIQTMDYPVRGLCLNATALNASLNETMLECLRAPLTEVRLALYNASLHKNVLQAWHDNKLGHSLERLSLTHYNGSKVPDPEYDTLFLEFFSQACGTLTHLAFKQASLSDAAFAHSLFWSTLRSLHLSNMSNMTGSCFRQLARHASELRHLEVGDTVASTHLWHFRHHPSLQTLVLTPPNSRRSCLFILPELLSTLTSLRHLVIRAPQVRLKRAFLDEIVQFQALRHVQQVSWTFRNSYLLATLGDMPELTHLTLHLHDGLSGHENVLDLTAAPKLQHLTLHLLQLELTNSRYAGVPFVLRTHHNTLECCDLNISGGTWSGQGPYLDLRDVRCDTLRLTLNVSLLEHIHFPQVCRRLELNLQEHFWQKEDRHAGYTLCLTSANVQGLREVRLERSGIQDTVRITVHTDPTVTLSE